MMEKTNDSTPEVTPEKQKEETKPTTAELNARADAEDRLLKIEERKEALRARGGQSEAGQTQPEQKEETAKEYHMRVKKEIAQGKTEW